MTHPLFYENFLDRLNRGAMTVVDLHPAGHGKNPRVKVPLSVELLLQNAMDALEWMREEFPNAPTVVLGSSQGGVLAILVAARADVDRVIAHNVLDPDLSATIRLTRLPRLFQPAYNSL